MLSQPSEDPESRQKSKHQDLEDFTGIDSTIKVLRFLDSNTYHIYFNSLNQRNDLESFIFRNNLLKPIIYKILLLLLINSDNVHTISKS